MFGTGFSRLKKKISQHRPKKKEKPAGSRDYCGVCIWLLHAVTNYVVFFHIQGIVFSVLLGLGYFAGGVAAAKFANDYDDIDFLFSELETIMQSLAAAAVCL